MQPVMTAEGRCEPDESFQPIPDDLVAGVGERLGPLKPKDLTTLEAISGLCFLSNRASAKIPRI